MLPFHRTAFLSIAILFAAIGGAKPSAGAQEASDEPVNVLRLDSATVEQISVPRYATDQLAALVDDDPSTACNFPVAEGAPVDIVYHFDGTTVSPEKFVVQLPQNADAAAVPRRVEILVSRLSATAGYRSLRADPLQATAEPQTFAFRPAAAQWVLVRITPHPQATEISLAELAVLGHEGPPVSRYEFKESPAEAFEVLERLEESVDISVSDVESALFADAKDGRLDEVSFAEAALLASGVTDDEQRRRMLERIAALEQQAQAALAEGEAAFAKGERLLKWLHENVLSGGYDAGQTDVSVILEKGTYNCVSSATIYNILGRQLQLDLRAIEVPDHAFSILYDGTRHADVETTNAQGFNPARNPEVLRELEEQKGLHYVPERNREKRREVDEAGLVALIYYNHGVQLTKEQRYAQALAAYFRALSLDRESASAVQNVLAVLSNWSKELGDAGTYERALEIVGIGLQLAPEDATLQHNQEALWTNWVNDTIDRGDAQEALAILERAHEAVPDRGFDAMRSWVFIRPAEKRIDENDWNEALAIAGRGLSQIDGEARSELEKWRNGVFLRWSSAELESGRFREAADVLARGLKVDPSEERFKNNLGYLAQEWSWSAYQNENAEKAQSVLAELLERFPQVPAIAEAAENFVARAVQEHRKAGRYEEALQMVSKLQDTLQEHEARQTLICSVYDDWANSHIEKGEWEEALEIYANALKTYSGATHLQNNRLATWDAWARAHMQDGDWASAVAVYEKALQQHPDSQLFRQNLGYVAAQLATAVAKEKGNQEAATELGRLVQRHPQLTELKRAAESHVHGVLSSLLDEDRFDAALQTLQQYGDVLDQEQQVKAGRIIYDRWARVFTERKQWEKAVEVYTKGLKRYPDDAHLTTNAVATWNSWAATHIDAKEWSKAINVYDEALKEFPDNATLKNNRTYCQQQLDDRDD